jgi:hypothetical protein
MAVNGRTCNFESLTNHDINILPFVNLLRNYIQIKVRYLNCNVLCDSHVQTLMLSTNPYS